jgi:hypothetical protein
MNVKGTDSEINVIVFKFFFENPKESHEKVGTDFWA